LVAARKDADDAVGMRVMCANRDVEGIGIKGDTRFSQLVRGGAFGRLALHKFGDDGALLPHRLREPAIEDDRRRRRDRLGGDHDGSRGGRRFGSRRRGDREHPGEHHKHREGCRPKLHRTAARGTHDS
jgi:hypothetical protein